MEKAEKASKPVDWAGYFDDIKYQCPWSRPAWHSGLIAITDYDDGVLPLGNLQARIYLISEPDATVEAIADELDQWSETDEWLFSYPGYGPYATPEPVLIQQNRAQLNAIRDRLKNR